MITLYTLFELLLAPPEGTHGRCFSVTDGDSDISKQDPLQRMINSFIVKIWLTNPERRDSAEWRGQITHVSTQERRYLKSLEDIAEFIKPFLQRMGVRVGSVSRFMRWLQRKAQRTGLETSGITRTTRKQNSADGDLKQVRRKESKSKKKEEER